MSWGSRALDRWLWSGALAGAGIVATIAGLIRLHTGEIGFAPRAVLDSIGSQLGATVPSGLAVLLAVGVNVATASLVLRVVRGRPYRSASEFILFGLASAVVLDTIVLMALGSFGWFRADALLLLHVAAIAVAWRLGRPLIERDVAEPDTPGREPGPLVWILIAVVWSAPVILSIASPVVPFADVLPNHVAPVEHVRTFGAFRDLATVPSPIYGPSRSFLGYIGFVSAVSVMTRVEAVRTVAALIIPAAFFMFLATFRLARRLGGRTAAVFAVLAMPLTVAYLRLPDVRSSTIALPLACVAIASALDRDAPSRTVVIATATAATLIVHPIIGAILVVVLLVFGMREGDRDAGVGLIRGSCAALVFSVPQAIAMVGVQAPAWTFLLAVPAAVVVGAWLPDPRPHLDRSAVRRTGTVLGAVVIIVALISAPSLVRATGSTALDLARFPLLAAGAGVAVIVLRRRLGTPALVLIGLPFVLAAAARVVPGSTRAFEAARFESVAKIGEFWLPLMLAVFAGMTLAHLWNGTRSRSVSRLVVVAAIVVAAYPFASRPFVNVAPVEEVRYSQSLAIALHHAERGAWGGYADPYRVIDRPRAEVVDALRDEQRAGRLTDRSEVLHVASSHQQWEATPLAVFAGVKETIASPDPERSIHTLGGRLLDSDDLSSHLRDAYDYVVVEGRPRRVDVATIERAPYRRIFTNGYAEIWRRAS